MSGTLFNDLIHASELTVFARRTQEEIDAREGSLSAFFPNALVNSDTVKYTINEGKLVRAAEYRAFDTEPAIGGARGGRQVALSLAPVSLKNRVGELDTIRGYAGNDAAVEKIARVGADVVSAVVNRIEALRGTVLETGRITINENGFYADEDLGRSPDMTTRAGVLWGEDSATPLDDLIAWAEKYEEKNGVLPGTILASNKIISVFQRHPNVRAAIGGTAVRTVASLEEINAVLSSYGLPVFTRFGKNVNVEGTVKKVLSPNKVFLLPPKDSIELGQTVFGRAAEAEDPAYGLAAANAPGLVVGVLRSYAPYSYWVHANAIALPVLTNPDASMVAEVLGA